MKITASLGVKETDDTLVANIVQRTIGIVFRFEAVRIEKPIVVGILVMIAGNLLLIGTLRIDLHVRMKKTAAITHVLQRSPRAVHNLKRTVLADFRAP